MLQRYYKYFVLANNLLFSCVILIKINRNVALKAYFIAYRHLSCESEEASDFYECLWGEVEELWVSV